MPKTTPKKTPPMKSSDESTKDQLALAREQGEAYRKTLDRMANEEAHDGGTKRAGEYLVGYAVEEAEGMYHRRDGELEWQNPTDENVHIEITACDGSDGRFVPGLEVHVTVVDGEDNEVGTHRQPFLWHPWLYHYGRNWKVPGDGSYTLRVRIEPPAYGRHDKKNGKRFAEPVEVEFTGVEIKTGRKKS